LGNKGQEIYGDWFYLPKAPIQEELFEIVKRQISAGKASKKADFYWFVLIFDEESGRAGQNRRAWLVVRANSKGQFHLIRTFPYIQDERFVRIPGLEGLAAKRITLIGCGSLGSKIAVNLASSGVKYFHLVDYDYFEPNNSVRHELGAECFGIDKEKALLNRLCSLNPAVSGNSDTFHFQVASVELFTREKQFYDLARSSDLIIDTTAVHSVGHSLNELSFDLQIPVLYASVTNGAWGGEVVRVVPGKTPCWLCWLDEYYENKPPTEPESTGEVFAPGCDQPTFTGTTYDLGIVANLATSLAVETLLSPNGDYSKNYIRWSGKDKNGKPIFLTEILKTNHQERCDLCEP